MYENKKDGPRWKRLSVWTFGCLMGGSTEGLLMKPERPHMPRRSWVGNGVSQPPRQCLHELKCKLLSSAFKRRSSIANLSKNGWINPLLRPYTLDPCLLMTFILSLLMGWLWRAARTQFLTKFRSHQSFSQIPKHDLCTNGLEEEYWDIFSLCNYFIFWVPFMLFITGTPEPDSEFGMSRISLIRAKAPTITNAFFKKGSTD